MRKYLLLLLILFFSYAVIAQSLNVDVNSRQDRIIERATLLSEEPVYSFPNIKPYDAMSTVTTAIEIESPTNRNELQYIYDEYNDFLLMNNDSVQSEDSNNEGFKDFNKQHTEGDARYRTRKPLLRYFYQTPSHFFQYDHPGFHLRINPIAHFAYGKEGNDALFWNQRGAVLRASIDDRVFISTNIVETQAFLPRQFRNYESLHKAIPQNGFYKSYNSTVLDNVNGYDYLNSQAVLGVKISRHITGQFGYSRHFIGNGMRSLFLSDFSDNYLNLNLRTKFKRFFYQNIYGEVFSSNTRLTRGDKLLPKKYFAAHYLGVNITPDFQLGIFESVTFSRNNHFEFHYLLPIILYRTVEGAIGSPDNVILGLDARWDLFNQFRLYGQIAFDELKVNELILDNQNWWGNKYAVQLGFLYANSFNIKGLDLQVEANIVRPWMYSHADSSANYVHGNTPLAHPMGANLREIVGRISYRPSSQWHMELKFMINQQGIGSDSLVLGNDPRVSNRLRQGVYGHTLLQGDILNTNLLNLHIEYMLFHNFNLYIQAQQRIQKHPTSGDYRSRYISGGLRWNIGRSEGLF